DSEIRMLVRDSDQLQAGYWSQCCTSQTIPTPLDTSSLLEAEARKVRPQPQADVFHDGSEGLCCNVHRSPSLRGSSESHASSQPARMTRWSPAGSVLGTVELCIN